LRGQTPFILGYGQEEVVPLEVLVPSLHIETITNMTERGIIQERLIKLMELEEYMIMVGFHQEVHKARDKSRHEKQIKKKRFKEGDLVLLYDNKFLQHLGKFRMHWLGSYEMKYVIDGGFVQLKELTGTKLQGMMNGSQLKLYRDSQTTNSL
jgi:hypothetical protein